MDRIEKILCGESDFLTASTWLRNIYLPRLVERFNNDECRKRLGIYKGEKIPENERNLADVRNRVSLIIEYELARLSNNIIESMNKDGFFWSYVVANRFPDLEIRKRNGDRGLRIEVKCLQSIAEEKAANFDTLRKDINPNTDFVVVFLWEWDYQVSTTFGWDRAPKLINHYLFHAASLAELRDAYWLNRPPATLGNGFQGFDIRFAVNCNNGVYSLEEGNYGKLMRIWQKDFQYPPKKTPIIDDTINEYERLKKGVIVDGFVSLCKLCLPRLSLSEKISIIEIDGVLTGVSGEFCFILKSTVNKSQLEKIKNEVNSKYILKLTEKYVATLVYMEEGDGLYDVIKNIKPKNICRALFNLS